MYDERVSMYVVRGAEQMHENERRVPLRCSHNRQTCMLSIYKLESGYNIFIIWFGFVTLSPCCTLQNVVQTRECKPCQLNKLSSHLLPEAFYPIHFQY